MRGGYRFSDQITRNTNGGLNSDEKAGGNAGFFVGFVMPRLDRGIQYAAAFRSMTNGSGILGRPVIDERKRRRPSDGYAGR
jgi:hypothetical protein